MNKAAKLSDILDAMNVQREQTQHYFDRQTGRIELIDDEDNFLAHEDEPDEETPDWQREMAEMARAIDNDETGRFVPLPSSFDIHEWDIMRQFAVSQAPADAVDTLMDAVHGRGAFRRFKARLTELDLWEDWHKFRDERYRQIALEWSRENGIPLEPDDPPETPQQDESGR